MTRIPAIDDRGEDAAAAGRSREPEPEAAREPGASSQELLRAITDNSTSLIYALDETGRFLLINRRLESVLGVPRETLIGRTREAILPSGDAAAHRANDLRVLAEGRAITFEEENDEPDGRHVYLSVKFPVVDGDGRTFGIGGVSTDITERKKAEDRVKGQIEELQRWRDVMLDREARVQELKREVNELCRRAGEPARYASEEAVKAEAGDEAASPES